MNIQNAVEALSLDAMEKENHNPTPACVMREKKKPKERNAGETVQELQEFQTCKC